MSKSLWSRSVWNSLFSRVTSTRRPARRRKALTKHFDSHIAAESLEQRLVPTVTTSFALGTLTIISDNAANDSIVVKAGSTYTDVTVNGAFLSRINAATSNTISTVNFTGAGGSDTLEVKSTNQSLTVGLTGVETLKLTSTKSATVTSDAALALGVSSVSGDLTLSTTAGAISQSGKVSVSGIADFNAQSTGAAITLTNAGNSFGTLKLRGTTVAVTEAGSTDLGKSTTTAALTLTSTGAITDSGQLVVGGVATFTATRNAITLDDPTSTFASTLVLTGTNVAATDSDGGGVDLGTTKATGTLTVTSAGNVTQSGATGITVGGLMTINATGFNITLAENGGGRNNFGAVAVKGVDVSLKERSSAVLAESTITGNLGLISGGSVTDSGTLTVAGTTTINGTGTGLIAITLDDPDSAFTGALQFDGTNIAVTNSLATVLGNNALATAFKATGTFTLTSAGAVSEAAVGTVISVGGRATISAVDPATSVRQNVLLNGTSADNYGSIGVDGAVVSINESGDTDLYTTTTTGALTVVSTGNITDRGDVIVGGATALTVGSGKSITLNSTGSEYTGAISVTGSTAKNVAVTNVLGTVLGNMDITGTLNVTSLGLTSNNLGIEQTGTLKVDGRATFTATDLDITLSGANEFGSISFDGENVTLNEADATTGTNLFTSTAKGNLSLTSTGDITDSGTLTVIGNTTLSNAGKNITLDSGASTFAGTVSFTASQNVVFKDNDLLGLTLGTSTLSGTLSVIAKGNITDSGALTGTAGFNSATFVATNGGDINLDTTTLAAGAGGTLSMTADYATITMSTPVILGATTLTGALSLTTTGTSPVTDSGKVVVADTVTIDTSAGGSDNITLDSVGNSFGSLLLTGAAATIVEASATDLGTSTLTGLLTVTSSGSITDSGKLIVGAGATLTSNGGSISLNDPTSTFVGTLTLQGADITVDNNAAGGTTNLGKVTASGDFTLTGDGTVTQTGGATTSITVGGLISVTTTDDLVTLGSQYNNFGSIAVDSKSTGTTGAAVTITEGSDTDLSSITATTLNVTSYGSITDTILGKLKVTSTTDLTTQNSGSITLDRTNTELVGALRTTGSNVAVTNAEATILGATTATGTFTITSDRNVTKEVPASTVITVGGLATITTTGDVITLAGTGNNFGSIAVTGASATLKEDSATDLGTSNVTGTFGLTSGGKVTDSGTLTIGGTTTIDATTSFDIQLDQSLSTFGTLNLTGKDVAVAENADTVLKTIVAGGTLSITSTGQITDDAASTMSAVKQVIITSTAPLTAPTYAILLDAAYTTRTGAGFVPPFVAPLTAPQYIGLSTSVTTDTDAPAAPSAPDLLAASDTGTSNSDNITSDNTPTFTGTAEAYSTVKIYDGSTLVGSGTATSGGTYSVTTSTLSDGAHTIKATATDIAGNVSADSTTLSVTIDATAPTVTSATPSVSGPIKTGAALTFTVVFSESVTSVAASNFTLVGTGTASATVTSVDVTSGTTFVVTVGTIAGDGSLTLNFTNDGTVVESAEPANLATDFVGASAVTIDNTAPTLSAANITNDTVGNIAASGTSIIYTVVFVDTNGVDATSVTTADFSNVGTAAGTTIASVTPTTGVANTYTVVVTTTASNTGTVILRVLSAGSITDQATNALAANVTDDDTVTLT